MKAPVHGVAPGVSLAATANLTPLLTDASGSTSSLKPVQATAHGWAVPWTLLLLVVVLSAAVSRRTRSPAPKPRTAQGA